MDSLFFSPPLCFSSLSRTEILFPSECICLYFLCTSPFPIHSSISILIFSAHLSYFIRSYFSLLTHSCLQSFHLPYSHSLSFLISPLSLPTSLPPHSHYVTSLTLSYPHPFNLSYSSPILHIHLLSPHVLLSLHTSASLSSH